MLAALRIAVMAAHDIADAPGGFDLMWVRFTYDGRILRLSISAR
jgi:hypothetical protein